MQNLSFEIRYVICIIHNVDAMKFCKFRIFKIGKYFLQL